MSPLPALGRADPRIARIASAVGMLITADDASQQGNHQDCPPELPHPVPPKQETLKRNCPLAVHPPAGKERAGTLIGLEMPRFSATAAIGRCLSATSLAADAV